jgi:hypothetical protein
MKSELTPGGAKSKLGVISGIQSEVDEQYVLLGYYAASSGNFLPTFRANLSDLSSRFKNKKESLWHNTELIQVRMWAVISLSCMVLANRIVASGLLEGSVVVRAARERRSSCFRFYCYLLPFAVLIFTYWFLF